MIFSLKSEFSSTTYIYRLYVHFKSHQNCATIRFSTPEKSISMSFHFKQVSKCISSMILSEHRVLSKEIFINLVAFTYNPISLLYSQSVEGVR